ncbi:hypothetical protein ACIBH1_13445 [Nonomuraea sp. NPDC050663]|uniref:hypothetical protein n=1 Tax=Nonomuraea sp. NPDC050663 TaxID=3364370 RepID=UPI0037B279A5
MRRSLAVAALGLAVLTGCGSQTGGGPQISATSAPTSQAPAAAAELKSAAEVSGVMAKKLEELKSFRATMSGTNAGQPTSATMALELVSPGTFNIETTTEVQPGKKMRILILQEAIFIETPAGEPEPEPGKPWVKLPGDNPMSKLFAQIGKMADPSQSARMAGMGELTAAAPDGDNTRYTIKIDMSKAMATPEMEKILEEMVSGIAGGTSGADPKAALEAMKKSLAGVVMTYDVWIDGQGLPTKVATKMPAAGAEQNIEMTFSDWGKVPPITAPPADKVSSVNPFQQ